MAITAPTFTGFRPEAVDFLANSRSTTTAIGSAAQADYEQLLKAPMEALVAAMAERFAARDIPLQADPKRSVFRIYRDTRFSQATSRRTRPTAAATLPLDGAGRRRRSRSSTPPHTPMAATSTSSPARCTSAAACGCPTRPRLDAFRRAIVEDPDRVRAALEEPGFVAAFGSVSAHEHLKRMPPGVPADHPMADLFLFKDVVFGRPMSDDEVLSPSLPDILADAYAAGMPVFRLLATIRA